MTIDDLALVQKEVWTGRTKWYNIGLELGLSPETLDAIELRERGDPDVCLRATLKQWLRKPECYPSWERLAESLGASPVGLGDLADRIKKNHCSN